MRCLFVVAFSCSVVSCCTLFSFFFTKIFSLTLFFCILIFLSFFPSSPSSSFPHRYDDKRSRQEERVATEAVQLATKSQRVASNKSRRIAERAVKRGDLIPASER